MNKHLNKLNLEVTELETQVGDSPECRVGDKTPWTATVPRAPHCWEAFHPDPGASLGKGEGILFHSEG